MSTFMADAAGESHLRRLPVGGLDAHAAEPEDAAGAAAGRQQLVDDGFVSVLQRQHGCTLQGGETLSLS